MKWNRTKVIARVTWNSFLVNITRTDNCVNLYKEKEDLFEHLCDSCGKVQKMLESVFGK